MSLQVGLRAVQLLGGLPVARAKNQVVGPHWEVAERARLVEGADGSTRPAAYAVRSRVQADVVLEIRGATAGAPATLEGALGPLTLLGDLSLADGLQTVRVSGRLGDALARHAGDAAWRLLLPSPLPVERTRLEIFVVFDGAPPFFPAGVWCEALRLLYAKAGITGRTGAPEAMAALSRFCHRDHSLRYEAQKGRNAYGVNHRGALASGFDLTAFLAAAHPEVSCFDLLAALIVLGGALGIDANWLLEDDDFFLQTSDLIGFGPCNNPFFLDPDASTPPVVTDPNDPNRQAFSQHGFCEVEGTIYDACVGPYTGEKVRQEYLDAVVDLRNRLGLRRLRAERIAVRPMPIPNLI